MRTAMTGVLLAALCLFGLTGCTSQCDAYCERFRDCVNADLEVGQCADKCEEASKQNEAHAEKVEECAQCVEERTCSEAFSSCVDDCFGVQGP